MRRWTTHIKGGYNEGQQDRGPGCHPVPDKTGGVRRGGYGLALIQHLAGELNVRRHPAINGYLFNLQ